MTAIIETSLKPSDNCLLYYLDETGHENFADPNYSLFGIGGCAALTESCYRLVDVPWREMKVKMFGSPDIPLHASSTLRTATEAQREAIIRFFKDNLFSRFASVIRFDSPIPHNYPPYQVVAGVTYNRMGELAIPYTIDSLALIFESTQRGNHLAESYFGAFEVKHEKHGDLPTEKYFMDKSVGEPGLEIADFIINAAGRHVRHFMRTGQREPNEMFKAIFHSVPRPLVQYMEIESAEASTVPATLSTIQ